MPKEWMSYFQWLHQVYIENMEEPTELTIKHDLHFSGDRNGQVGVGGLAQELLAQVLALEILVDHPVDDDPRPGDLV